MKKNETRTRNEKYEIHIRIMSSRIRGYLDCWFKFSYYLNISPTKPDSFKVIIQFDKWRQQHITTCLMIIDQPHTFMMGRLLARTFIKGNSQDSFESRLEHGGNPGELWIQTRITTTFRYYILCILRLITHKLQVLYRRSTYRMTALISAMSNFLVRAGCKMR